MLESSLERQADTQLGTLCIVIPTRNRGTLAINAINSVLENSTTEIRVVVSDNSNSQDEVETVRNYCVQHQDARLSYVRPPHPMPMAAHWEWALQQALLIPTVSHVLFLTDRMLFRAGELHNILLAIKRYPQDVISYTMDAVHDIDHPVRLVQTSWTGNLYRIESAALLHLNSQMVIHCSLPRMLNCVVPRSVFARVSAFYGTSLDAISPDFAFANRCLERTESILFLDRPILVNYALNRSNGASAIRGIKNKDLEDFMKSIGNIQLHYAAPVPQFDTVGNSVIHEYCLVKQLSGNKKMPDVNMGEYYNFIQAELRGMINEELRSSMQQLLDQQDYRHQNRFLRTFKKSTELFFSWKRMRVKFWWIATAPRFQPLWNKMRQYFNIEQPGVRDLTTEFESVEEALAYSNSQPRIRNKKLSYLDVLVRPKKLPL